jgi:D-glycero-D-manno-heptose 1,7-bisphosphate phosphatase
LKRAVFLDRDGVINRAIVQNGKPFPPRSAAEMEVLPDAHDALLRLREAGYVLIVVTNQPDVARGTQTRGAVEEINARLASELAIDDFVVCYHDDAAGCACRKPSPGGLLEAAARHEVDLANSYIVGDRWRDVEAGQRVGCTSFFIDYGYSERQPEPPFLRVRSLAEAAERIVADSQRRLNDERQ